MLILNSLFNLLLQSFLPLLLELIVAAITGDPTGTAA
jgi:hypothetical protein